jgi:hypothetical protein
VGPQEAASQGSVFITIQSSETMKVSLRGVFPDFLQNEEPYKDIRSSINDFIKHKLKLEKGLLLQDPHADTYLSDELTRYLKRNFNIRPLCVVHSVI